MIMSPELVQDYFDSVGVRKECPSCGRNRWFLHSNTEHEGTGVIRTRADGADKEKLKSSLTYVFAICENCGYIRQHARPLIVQWARARESGNGQTAN